MSSFTSNSTSTDTISVDYISLGYNSIVLIAIVLNLITSLAVHFRFKSICESDVVKRFGSMSKMLASPVKATEIQIPDVLQLPQTKS